MTTYNARPPAGNYVPPHVEIWSKRFREIFSRLPLMEYASGPAALEDVATSFQRQGRDDTTTPPYRLGSPPFDDSVDVRSQYAIRALRAMARSDREQYVHPLQLLMDYTERSDHPLNLNGQHVRSTPQLDTLIRWLYLYADVTNSLLWSSSFVPVGKPQDSTGNMSKDGLIGLQRAIVFDPRNVEPTQLQIAAQNMDTTPLWADTSPYAPFTSARTVLQRAECDLLTWSPVVTRDVLNCEVGEAQDYENLPWVRHYADPASFKVTGHPKAWERRYTMARTSYQPAKSANRWPVKRTMRHAPAALYVHMHRWRKGDIALANTYLPRCLKMIRATDNRIYMQHSSSAPLWWLVPDMVAQSLVSVDMTGVRRLPDGSLMHKQALMRAYYGAPLDVPVPVIKPSDMDQIMDHLIGLRLRARARSDAGAPTTAMRLQALAEAPMPGEHWLERLACGVAPWALAWLPDPESPGDLCSVPAVHYRETPWVAVTMIDNGTGVMAPARTWSMQDLLASEYAPTVVEGLRWSGKPLRRMLAGKARDCAGVRLPTYE